LRGIVLAAGGGRRLRPLTDELPKTLLDVGDGCTILEVVLANLAEVGVTDVTVVTGHGAARIEAAAPSLAARYGLELDLVFNPRHDTANNVYSLMVTRGLWGEAALLVNGDTVHPAEVERRLIAARGAGPLLLAVDDDKPLADEEMKVALAPDGSVTAVSKGLDPATAGGEYIGVGLIEPEVADPLGDALEAAFERDPGLYYEDGFQGYLDSGGACAAVPVGGLGWVEVDDHADLEVARGMTVLAADVGRP